MAWAKAKNTSDTAAGLHAETKTLDPPKRANISTTIFVTFTRTRDILDASVVHRNEARRSVTIWFRLKYRCVCLGQNSSRVFPVSRGRVLEQSVGSGVARQPIARPTLSKADRTLIAVCAWHERSLGVHADVNHTESGTLQREWAAKKYYIHV